MILDHQLAEAGKRVRLPAGQRLAEPVGDVAELGSHGGIVHPGGADHADDALHPVARVILGEDDAAVPQFLGDVFAEIARKISPSTVVISMAAGVKIEKLESWAPKARFIRMMPNVCAQIGQAMTAVTYGENIKPDEAKTAIEILSSAGKVEVVPEKLMDCVTAVSGSGPAFVFMFIEAMADAAVRCGMPRAQAYTYAAQTVYGSAGMVLAGDKNPAALKDMVCSPAGTTIEGVAALEKNGFRNAVIEAVTAACNRSIALGK